MSKEMKGRTRDQTQVVQAACRKRFPALPNFVSTTHTGVLQCHGPEYPGGFTVTVRANGVSLGALPFQIIDRSAESLRARTTKEADTGTLKGGMVLSLNFEYGRAQIIPVDKPEYIVSLECREQQP